MTLAFKDHLLRNFPEVFESKILLAISGGVDSVVLAHLCKDLDLNLSLAHCNFNLRGEESQGDEDFVLDLADHLETEIFVESFETRAFAEEKKISVQMAARDLRYSWFEELTETMEFDYVLTAHHANDNLESFFINFIRGTGLDGLLGIPARNGNVLRPLLIFSRTDIENFAKSRGLSWREDSSNKSDKYLRNKLRNQVMPVLLEMNPQLLESFEKTRSHLEQSSELVEDYLSLIFPRLVQEDLYGYKLDLQQLRSIPHRQAVLFELLRGFGFKEWSNVADLLEAETGKLLYSRTHRLIKERDALLLTALPENKGMEFELEEEEELVMLPIGTFHISQVDALGVLGDNIAFLDKNKLQFPLIIRKWRKEDSFIPYGMKGKKKIAKYFKDEKLSLPEKENVWLLCSGNEIVWVINKRVDQRFSVSKQTKEILKITYTS